MVTHMDKGIGEIMSLLKKLGIDENTIVIFASDNGPAYNRLGGSDSEFFDSASDFHGYKGDLYEGAQDDDSEAIITQVLVEEVQLGVPGADEVLDGPVLVDVDVLGVDVADQQADGRASGDALEEAADDLNAVGLQTGRVDRALTRATLVQLGLDHLDVELHSWGHAVDDRQQRTAVTRALGRRVPTV